MSIEIVLQQKSSS